MTSNGLVLFGQSTCGPCRQVKDAFEVLGIPYEYVEVTHVNLRVTGVVSVPTLKETDESGKVHRVMIGIDQIRKGLGIDWD